MQGSMLAATVYFVRKKTTELEFTIRRSKVNV